MSIGKSSLARAAAVSAPRAAAESTLSQPLWTARQVAVTAITLPKGASLAQADAALVKSIKKHGLLEPLTLAQTEDGALVLLGGTRRLAAAIAAGLDTVPAAVMPMAATAANAARREITRFSGPSVVAVSGREEAATAVGQAMPAWLL